MQSSIGILPNGEPILAPAPDSKPLYLQGVHELNTELKESEKKRGEKALQITSMQEKIARSQEKLSRYEEELGQIEAHLQRVRIEGVAEGLMAAPEKGPVQRRRNSFGSNSFGSAVTRSAARSAAAVSAVKRTLSFPVRPKVGVSVGPPPLAAPRAGEPAASPVVHHPTPVIDSPPPLFAAEPAASPVVHHPTPVVDSPPPLGECRDANSPAKLRAAELAKATCPPPDKQSPSGRRL